MTTDFVPTEAAEQTVFVQWLRLKGYKHFRVPSETYTKSWKQKATNKALGVVKGVPDLFVIANDQLIAIEMKRRKGSRTSPEQIEWLEYLKNAGIPAYVAKGSDEAIRYVELWAGVGRPS